MRARCGSERATREMAPALGVSQSSCAFSLSHFFPRLLFLPSCFLLGISRDMGPKRYARRVFESIGSASISSLAFEDADLGDGHDDEEGDQEEEDSSDDDYDLAQDYDEVALAQDARDDRLSGDDDDEEDDDDDDEPMISVNNNELRRRAQPLRQVAAGDPSLTNSITEGCFLVAAAATVPRQPLRTPYVTPESVLQVPSFLGGAAHARAVGFARASASLDDAVRKCSLSLLRTAINHIVTFVLHSHDGGSGKAAAASSEEDGGQARTMSNEVAQLLEELDSLLGSRTPEMPAAMVVMGVNQVDHNRVFALLLEQLHSDASSRMPRVPECDVVRLRSKDCPTRNYALTTVLKQLDEHLTRRAAEHLMTTTTTTTTTATGTGIGSKPTSMRHIWSKYQALPHELRPTRLLVLFEDAECFSSETLQLLIHVCGEYVARLPFVFLFGIATSPERLYTLLPPSSLSRLRIEHFSLVVARKLVRSALRASVEWARSCQY